ncbi:hydantoinase/oxoprolinase N-terminal domain-containing protein [Nguyenibacter vanlangensis]|uniref:Hydantoinase/oxoprolinase family protein n=1 Tax=Nguyenibacter vanlangensis TaxID=1216886 RepID=A0A7Y7IVA6_9PROT|nr:hydantoinase/oxoprolinase family protein [Nguyenibacter vanlangensis]NVN10984.1 hydantoinase/oxoprolinase family protein [Nguyenibacter vanlangensis]
MSRIGIDVGGTNTDAVLIGSGGVRAAVKTGTTPDIAGGIQTALARLLEQPGATTDDAIDAVMIGTTHFVNAVVQRRELCPVGALRIGLPASASLPPFSDWPDDLVPLVRGQVHMVEGGHEYDGRRIVALDRDAIRRAARDMASAGLRHIAVSAVFSPLVADDELEAERILAEEIPDVSVTLSHRLGRIGLLERENVALLNATLQPLARRTIDAFIAALRASGIAAPLFLTRNDGTVAHAAGVYAVPVYCFASGPTNSMRGAAFLSGMADAMVVDVGGTTSDFGTLRAGFPREANAAVEIGGVRTLFRMPELLSIGLGGGSIVSDDGAAIGPQSLGFRLLQEGRIFGGTTLSATDVAVAAGRVSLGDATRVADLSPGLLHRAQARMAAMLAEAIDRTKSEAGDVTLVAVGGGAFLVPDRIEGVHQIVRVPHHAVANAVGAAIARISGEVDRIFTGVTRDTAIDTALTMARDQAVADGAAPATLETVEIEDIPLTYIPGDARRVRVRVVGDISHPPAAT